MRLIAAPSCASESHLSCLQHHHRAQHPDDPGGDSLAQRGQRWPVDLQHPHAAAAGPQPAAGEDPCAGDGPVHGDCRQKPLHLQLQPLQLLGSSWVCTLLSCLGGVGVFVLLEMALIMVTVTIDVFCFLS